MSAAANVTGWYARRVDEFVSIMYLGDRWCVLDLPGVQVGDLVFCLPTPQGDALRVRATNAQIPEILVARSIEPGLRDEAGFAPGVILGEGDRIRDLVAAGTRRNGKQLITPARAEAMARAASKMDLPALPREPILGSDYVRHPTPAPVAAGSCALCLACPHRLAAQEIAATGVKG